MKTKFTGISVKVLKDRLAAKKAEVEDLQTEIRYRQSLTRVTCGDFPVMNGACRASFQIRNVTYVQTFWWDNEPYSEGFREGEGGFRCPHCGVINRLYRKEDKWLVDLKLLFKAVETDKKR
jgi:hypothetical protein